MKRFKEEAAAELDHRLQAQSEVLKQTRAELFELNEEVVLNQLSLSRYFLEQEQGTADKRLSTTGYTTHLQSFLQADESPTVTLWKPPREYLCSSGKYFRAFLAPTQVPWVYDYPEYTPLDLTDPIVLQAPWADKGDVRALAFNSSNDNGVDRSSIVINSSGTTQITLEPSSGRPINPYGRTGLRGRGLLGRWGVNHAADTLVTRWRRMPSGRVLQRGGKPVLEFVAVFRKDGGGTWRPLSSSTLSHF